MKKILFLCTSNSCRSQMAETEVDLIDGAPILDIKSKVMVGKEKDNGCESC